MKRREPVDPHAAWLRFVHTIADYIKHEGERTAVLEAFVQTIATRPTSGSRPIEEDREVLDGLIVGARAVLDQIAERPR